MTYQNESDFLIKFDAKQICRISELELHFLLPPYPKNRVCPLFSQLVLAGSLLNPSSIVITW